MQLWLVQCRGGFGDDGMELEPPLLAVCTTEDRARHLAGHLWGHTGPGQPDGVMIEPVTADDLIPGDDDAGNDPPA